MNYPSKLSLAIAVLLNSPLALGLGLGTIQVQSGLNEPLTAEISVTENSPGEATGLKANLATAEDFERVGLDVSGVRVPLNFEVVNVKGQLVIKVTSVDPVREPFISFLIEASWANGRLLREYNVLLDPPIMAPAVISHGEPAVQAIPETMPLQSQPLPQMENNTISSQPRPTPTTPSHAVAPTPTPASPVNTPPLTANTNTADYGPVNDGDTLWRIAAKTRADSSVTMNQMMMALFNANPDAFIQGNINRLRKGAILRIPGQQQVQALSPTEAAAAVALQTQSWQRAGETTQVISAQEARSNTSRMNQSTAAKKEARLSLVPPKDGQSASGADRPGLASGSDNTQLRADLARIQEDLASKQQESQELRTRLQDLESLKQQQDKLIQLKDSTIADLQNKLVEVQEQTENATAAAQIQEEGSGDTEQPVDEATVMAVNEDAMSEVDTSVELNNQDDVAAHEEPQPLVTQSEQEETISENAEITTPEPMPESLPIQPAELPAQHPWYQQPAVLLGGSVGLLLGLVALIFGLRRKHNNADKQYTHSSLADAFEQNEDESDMHESENLEDEDMDHDEEELHGADEIESGDEIAEDIDIEEGDDVGEKPDALYDLNVESVPPVLDADDAGTSTWDLSTEEQNDNIEHDIAENPVEEGHMDENEGIQAQAPQHSVANQVEVVNTKLDLAKAYLDMGDTDGARSMLQEVLEEGNVDQREEAQRLLDEHQ